MSRRIARQIQKTSLKAHKKRIKYKRDCSSTVKTSNTFKKTIRKAMQQHVSMIRDYKSLKEAQGILKDIDAILTKRSLISKNHYELANLLQLAQMITSSAIWRRESRGVHLREDFPATDKKYLQNRVIKNRG